MGIVTEEAVAQGFELRYDKLSLPYGCRRLRIDVGLSENAPQSEVWLSEYPDLFVIGFEPNPVSCSKIIEQASNWPIKLSKENKSRFLLLNTGLGSFKQDSVDFYVTKDDPGQSSFLRPKEIGVAKIVKVPIVTLDEVSDCILWDDVTFVEYLKLDCQGYDLQVLKGATEILKHRVILCTAEASAGQYDGETNLLLDLVKFMKMLGFEYVNPKWSPLVRFKYRQVLRYLRVDDPTFINKRFYQDFIRTPFYVVQEG